jgi:hypothetical protein
MVIPATDMRIIYDDPVRKRDDALVIAAVIARQIVHM